MRKLELYLSAAMLVAVLPAWQEASGRVDWNQAKAVDAAPASSQVHMLGSRDLRHVGVHDAGSFYTPLSDGMISNGFARSQFDPETGRYIEATTYPAGSSLRYIWGGGLWVGGLVASDTLVSTGVDGWFVTYEILPADGNVGGVYRTGRFADDEFVTTLFDTIVNNFSGPLHTPMGLEVRHTSYSWADTLYDDFVIIDYVVKSIGGEHIRDGWVGIYLDEDISHDSRVMTGYSDDCSGFLDTLFADNDPTRRLRAAYSYDNDGDPSIGGHWDSTSVRSAVAVALLAANFPLDRVNFNWWLPNGNPSLDFGPRRIGTPEDPLRLFADSNLGAPVTDADRHYLLSHPEVDYDQIETAIHDSSDGWIPVPAPRAVDYADGYDTRFMYSFGPFDLMPGDSACFTIALVAAGNLHVNAFDFAESFDPLAPNTFRQKLDFSYLIRQVRRADSVYQSGYMLPIPGPPAGLTIADYDDGYVDLVWNTSDRPDAAGYYVYVKDTVTDDIWRRALGHLTADTAVRIYVFEPMDTYFFAVSLRDVQGRESKLSLPVSVVPARPHPPESLAVTLEGRVPVVSWRPHVDTALQVFNIYRSAWSEGISLYDSTVALRYYDYGAESGIKYNYKVSAVNTTGLESEVVGPVSAVPLALDQGILYCNLNRYGFSGFGLYPRKFTDRLYESVASVVPTSRFDIDFEPMPLKQMADYSIIIFDAADIPRISWIKEDSVAYYLRGGGKAVFITPAFGSITFTKTVSRYGPGNFYYDLLKLDSSVTPALVFQNGAFTGDLKGCLQQRPGYPYLEADRAKLDEVTRPVNGYIPLSGYLFPTGEAEPLYTYVSSNPDTVNHGQINGIRYLGQDYGVVLLYFPLVAMKETDNFAALRQALIDLGTDMSCGDVNEDGTVNIADVLYLINHLYRGGPPPNDSWRADADCSSGLGLPDILVLINYIFRGGWLTCCQ